MTHLKIADDGTAERPKSYWAQKNDKITAALRAAGVEGVSGIDFGDLLENEDLIVMPRSVGHGKWLVLVAGEPVAMTGSDGKTSGPMDAEEAAEAFLLASRSNEDVVIRPATDAELVSSVWGHIVGGGA